jgi:uncharacterized protein (DUF362 family)/NAD-dependent dihydropyrimidine dehydrogenase PreA subunit
MDECWMETASRKTPPRILAIDSDYSSMEQTVERILETFPFPWKDRRVLIKPNILAPSPPEKGVTTHPALVRSLVKSLRKRGAVCFVGDNPGLSGYAANEHCAEVSGIREAADGCFVNFAKDTVAHAISSRFLKKIVVSKVVLDADFLINVPRFKTHVQTKITGAVKNMFGLAVGGEKARVHLSAPRPENFSEALVDIYQLRIPDLTIMDAVVGMEGNGPSGKDLRPIGKVLASTDGVAVDGLMAAMMGLAPQSVMMLAAASRRGLGEVDPAKMEIQGTWAPLKKYRMPLTFASRGLAGTAINKVLYRSWVKPRLRVHPELCTRCGVCVNHCPVEALTLEEIPLLNPEKCIACYCCLELCSNQAIELTGWMKRLAKRRPS